MFDSTPPTSLDDLRSRVGLVIGDMHARIASASADDLAAGAQEVEIVAACERIRHMLDAVQLEAIAELDARRRSTHPPVDQVDPVAVDRAARAVERSVRAEVSMARRVSSGAAQHSHELARALVDHPRTRELLADGIISTPVAAAVCRESAALPSVDRRRLDAALGDFLPELTVRQAGAEARRLALALDPHGAEARAERARAGRSVGLRRDADAMATLRVYGPADEVVAAWRRLTRQALSDQASGAADGRTHRQITCDRALRVLRHGDHEACGDTTGAASTPPSAEIGLLMRPEVLFGQEDTPAVLEDYGPIPAGLARRIAAEAASRDLAWVRRLFTTPGGERLTSIDSRRRTFPAAIARLIRAADDTCLRPACDCGVRDIDHVHAHARGGTSTADNGDGLCQTDNLLKEMRGWGVSATVDAGSGTVDRVTWRTPTGHSYTGHRSRPGGVRGPEAVVSRTPSRSTTDEVVKARPTHAHRQPVSVAEQQLRHLIGRLRQ
ncbi:hypothetical protein FE697_015510 [Mumia zhuanghuii]|uniref:DUF222 domain-containing protein n=2 Tax=Mumia TaxID=1546255 RepID=A0ABW1QPN9_9ACTN|nr:MULTISPECIES: hypothetical protein [Mumia]KAA1420375.1 hypothetical protein FE697_015510 [Mumia zhuanghuii]